jgi:hypothetical protein
MYKITAVILVSFTLFGCASTNRVYDNSIEIETEYILPKVEDTPHFQRLKALLEADGYTYTHYEIGAGLVVWGTLNRTNRGYGSKDEGIRRIPGGDAGKSYYVSWDQYFMAFSDMHKICFDERNIREIKRVVDQLVLETDYDYSRLFRPSGGARWVFHPDTKYLGLCDDYSDLVYEKLSGLAGVSEIYKVSSVIGNHSWNEILLDDGRVIYLDATWYDTNGYYVDPTGNYVVEHTPQYMPTMFTFDRDLFSLGGTHYDWGDAQRSAGRNASPTVNRHDANDRIVEFDFHIGAYLNGWHENLLTFGMPLQIGVKFNFANMALSLLGEAAAGLGVPSVTELYSPLLEWHYGGMGEFYFPGKKIGLGFGYGIVDSYLIQIQDFPPSQTFNTTYMRFALIFRGSSKLTLYGNLYDSGNWGIGIMWH